VAVWQRGSNEMDTKELPNVRASEKILIEKEKIPATDTGRLTGGTDFFVLK